MDARYAHCALLGKAFASTVALTPESGCTGFRCFTLFNAYVFRPW
jgi:hypothetical protein